MYSLTSFSAENLHRNDLVVTRSCPLPLKDLVTLYIIQNADKVVWMADSVVGDVKELLARKALMTTRLLGGGTAVQWRRDRVPRVMLLQWWRANSDQQQEDDLMKFRLDWTAELLRRMLGCEVCVVQPVWVRDMAPVRSLSWESTEPSMKLVLANRSYKPNITCTQTGPVTFELAAPELLQEALSLAGDDLAASAQLSLVLTDLPVYGSPIGNGAALVCFSNDVLNDIHRWGLQTLDAALRALTKFRGGYCKCDGCPMNQPVRNDFGKAGYLPCPMHLQLIQSFSGMDVDQFFHQVPDMVPWQRWRFEDYYEAAVCDVEAFIKKQKSL